MFMNRAPASNDSMQPTALRAAVDAERSADQDGLDAKAGGRGANAPVT